MDGPVAVALDPTGGKIYWAQTVGNSIKRSDLNGGKLETLVEWPWVDGPVGIGLVPTEFAGAIPAVSEWGLAAMTLLILTAGTLVLVRRRRVARSSAIT